MMTKGELIRINRKHYEEYSKEIESMKGLEKLVAKNMVLKWIKGSNWMGGLSDSVSTKAYIQLMKLGYDEEEIREEKDRQIRILCDRWD